MTYACRRTNRTINDISKERLAHLVSKVNSIFEHLAPIPSEHLSHPLIPSETESGTAARYIIKALIDAIFHLNFDCDNSILKLAWKMSSWRVEITSQKAPVSKFVSRRAFGTGGTRKGTHLYSVAVGKVILRGLSCSISDAFDFCRVRIRPWTTHILVNVGSCPSKISGWEQRHYSTEFNR